MWWAQRRSSQSPREASGAVAAASRSRRTESCRAEREMARTMVPRLRLMVTTTWRWARGGQRRHRCLLHRPRQRGRRSRRRGIRCCRCRRTWQSVCEWRRRWCPGKTGKALQPRRSRGRSRQTGTSSSCCPRRRRREKNSSCSHRCRLTGRSCAY